MTSETTPSPVTARLVAAGLLPFALGYFISYLFRAVNAVIANDLSADLGLDPTRLGVLTSAYFITFALFQLPLGVLLDRYGPRRVEAALLLVAAAGAFLFAVGDDLLTLMIARGLIGFGVSACLMAAFTYNVNAWPATSVPLANGVITASGGLGALAASTPVAALLEVTDWRGIFTILGVATILAALLIYTVVPERRAPADGASLGRRIRVVGEIIISGPFLRIAPCAILVQAVFLAYQSLWAAEWMRDLSGFDRDGVAMAQQFMAVGIIGGYLIFGLLIEWLGRRGVPTFSIAKVGVALWIVNVLLLAGGWVDWPWVQWTAFTCLATTSLLAYPILSAAYPKSVAGRVNTTINLFVFVGAFALQAGVGAILEGLHAAGLSPDSAHRTVLGTLGMACLFAWLRMASPSTRRVLAASDQVS